MSWVAGFNTRATSSRLPRGKMCNCFDLETLRSAAPRFVVHFVEIKAGVKHSMQKRLLAIITLTHPANCKGVDTPDFPRLNASKKGNLTSPPDRGI